MRAIPGTHSRDLRRWAASLQRRRAPNVNRLAAHGCLRRLAWTRTLVARFSHSIVPARRVEQKLLQRTWAWIQHTHWLAQQVHLSWQAPVVAPLSSLPSRYFVTLPSAPAHHTTRLTVLAREHQTQCTTVLRTAAFRQSMAERLRLVATHVTAFVPVLATKAIVRSPSQSFAGTPKSVSAPDVERSVVTRLLRHNRRVEKRVVPSERVLLQRPSPPVSESPFVTAASPSPPQATGHNSGWSAVPPLQGLNITHITDEVVRQLDSRLIAARERLGHV
ncbi:hypothetical protein ACVIIV_005786 [Bradyrhizobium sp. USDA 4354]